MHVWNMPQDVFTATLGDHLRRVREGDVKLAAQDVSEANEAPCRRANKRGR